MISTETVVFGRIHLKEWRAGMVDYLAKQKEGEVVVDGLGRRLRLLCLVVAFFGFLLGGCKQQEEPTVKPVVLESVVLCGSVTTFLPLAVAEKQGFFPEQMLAVTVREFSVGKEALEAMFKGECDFATSAEPPVVEVALQRDDFRILGSLQTSDNQNRIVARTDRGIAVPDDLRGKRIATVKGTSAHYFLELFFEKYGLTSKDVAISFMKADDLLEAFTSGQVDAVAMTIKVIIQAQEALQDKAVLLESPGLYRNYYLIMVTTDLLEKRPQVAVRLLRALARAEDFIRQRPEEASAIAQASRKGSPAEIKQRIGVNQYQLTLDQAMLMGLEDATRWTLQQTGDGRLTVPNFLNLIAVEPLRTVNPDGVRLEK